jgi:hypothetical protein
LTPTLLIDAYLAELKSGKPFPIMDNSVRSVVFKQLFSSETPEALSAASDLLKNYPGTPGVLIGDLTATFKVSASRFEALSKDQQSAILDLLAQTAADPSYHLGLNEKKSVIDSFVTVRNFLAFSTLERLRDGIQGAIQKTQDRSALTDLYILHQYIDTKLADYWK